MDPLKSQVSLLPVEVCIGVESNTSCSSMNDSRELASERCSNSKLEVGA